MSTFPKIGFTLIVGTWMILGTSLASSAQAFLQQTTTTAPATTDKSTEPPAKPHQPRPNPDADGKYHVGDGVTAPILVHSVEPELAKNISHARCLVALTVGTDGRPIDVHLVPTRSDTKSDDDGNLSVQTRMVCINAAEQYRFKPAVFQGKPVAVDLKVEIFFTRYP